MRYTLDNNGYIKTVAWGCMTGNCAEYTGEVPAGYASLPEWADRACINAYYLDENGNLALDPERQDRLHTMYEQQEIDYSPVLRRDLFETNEVLDVQYKKKDTLGYINTITDARNIAPRIKIDELTGTNLTVFANSKNMLANDAQTQEINGLSFTRMSDGSVKVSGTPSADVEYTISGGGTEPIFALIQNWTYSLNVNGYECEMLYFDGETTEQVYTGGDGAISITENKKVSEVKLKFPAGKAVNDVIWPTLAPGAATFAAEEFTAAVKTYTLDYSDYTLADDAFILIAEGLAVLYNGGSTHVLGRRNMGLLNGYNTIYTDQANTMEITYTSNELLVDDMAFLQGKQTTTGKFMILEDGSIIATNGQFGGKVTCTELVVADGATVKGLKVGTNVEMGTDATITWSDLPSDVASTGQVTTIAQNAITTGNLIIGGLIYDSTLTTKQVILGVNKDGNLQVGTPLDAANYDKLRLYSPGIMQFFPDGQTADTNYTLELGVSYAEVDAHLIVAGSNDLTIEGGRLYCTGIGTASDYPSVVYCNNVAVQTDTKISNNNAGFNSTYGYVQEYSGSSEKFKHDIHSMPAELKEKIEGLYDVEVKCWKYNEDYLDKEDELFGVETFGLIAEDLNEILPEAITHKADGTINNYRDRSLLNAMLVLLQDQKKEIDALKETIIKIGGTV